LHRRSIDGSPAPSHRVPFLPELRGGPLGISAGGGRPPVRCSERRDRCREARIRVQSSGWRWPARTGCPREVRAPPVANSWASSRSEVRTPVT